MYQDSRSALVCSDGHGKCSAFPTLGSNNITPGKSGCAGLSLLHYVAEQIVFKEGCKQSSIKAWGIFSHTNKTITPRRQRFWKGSPGLKDSSMEMLEGHCRGRSAWKGPFKTMLLPPAGRSSADNFALLTHPTIARNRFGMSIERDTGYSIYIRVALLQLRVMKLYQ